MIELNERLEVIIAAATQGEVYHWTQEIAWRLSNLGGGCTVVDGEGFYLNLKGGLDVDTIRVILFDTCDAQEAFEKIQPTLAAYGVAAQQEAVYVRVNNVARKYYTTELVDLVRVDGG